MRKRSLSLACKALALVAFVAYLSALSSCGDRQSPSVLRATPAEVDFGHLNSRSGSQDYLRNVKLQNVGTGPVSIRELRSTCTCVALSLEKKTIPPGEAASLNIVLVPPLRLGENKYLVYILTGDDQVHALALKALYSDVFIAVPDRLLLTDLAENEERGCTLTLVAWPGEDEWKVTDVVSKSSALRITSFEQIGKNRFGCPLWRVSITARAPETDVERTQLDVLTNLPGPLMRRTVPVTLSAKKEFVVSPSAVVLRQSDGAQSARQRLYLRRIDGGSFGVEDVSATPPANAEVVEADATSVQIEVSTEEPIGQGMLGGSLRISVRGRARPIRLPFLVCCPPAADSLSEVNVR